MSPPPQLPVDNLFSDSYEDQLLFFFLRTEDFRRRMGERLAGATQVAPAPQVSGALSQQVISDSIPSASVHRAPHGPLGVIMGRVSSLPSTCGTPSSRLRRVILLRLPPSYGRETCFI